MRLVPIWSVNFTAGLSVNQPSQDTEVDTCQQLKHKAFVVLDFFLMVSYILYILKSQAVELHGIITPCSYIPSFYFVNAKTVHLWVTIKMNMFPSSSFCQQTMQTFTCYSQLWQAAWKTGGSSFFSPPFLLLRIKFAVVELSRSRSKAYFWSQTKYRDCRSRAEWFMMRKHPSIPKIKGRVKYWRPLNTLISYRSLTGIIFHI